MKKFYFISYTLISGNKTRIGDTIIAMESSYFDLNAARNYIKSEYLKVTAENPTGVSVTIVNFQEVSTEAYEKYVLSFRG